MKKFFCCLLSLTLCFSPIIDNTPLLTNTQVYATSQEQTYDIIGIGVNAPTQEQIAGFYSSYKISSALSTNDTYAINPLDASAPYSTGGQLSSTTQTHAINTLNYIRYVAGLSYNVTNDDDYAQLAQDGAFLNYLNKTLTHYPDNPGNVTDALFESGYTGAKSSNIASASYHNKISDVIIGGWLEDGDSSNIDRLGHRRWILNPSMAKTGFGSIEGNYSAMYAFDKSGTDVTGVAWPAQNTPLNTFSNTYPWSYSANRELTGSVEVNLTQLNKSNSWTFNSSSSGTASSGNYFNVNNDGYGQKGCVVFDPNISISTGDVFWVEITENNSIIASYPVSFFNVGDVTSNSSLTPSATKSTFTYSSSGDSNSSDDNSGDDNSNQDDDYVSDSTVSVSSSGSITFDSSNSYPLLNLNDLSSQSSLTVSSTTDNFYIKTSSATTKAITINLPTYDKSNTITWTIPAGVKLNGDVNLAVKIDSSINSDIDTNYTSNGSITFLHSGNLVSSGSGLTLTFPTPYGSIASGDTIKIQKSGSTTTVYGKYVNSSTISASFDNCSTWIVSSSSTSSGSSGDNFGSSDSNSGSTGSGSTSSGSTSSSSSNASYSTGSVFGNGSNSNTSTDNNQQSSGLNTGLSMPYCSSFAYIPEFHNLVMGQLINLTKISVNGANVGEWYYDRELTKPISTPATFVVTQSVLNNGIYNKLSQGNNVTHTNTNVNTNYSDSSYNYIYNSNANYSYGNTPVPSTSYFKLNKLF